MITIIFLVALIYVVWKMFVFGLKATWGIAKFVCTVLLLPLFLVGLLLAGLIYMAVPILVTVGIVASIGGVVKNRK